MKLTAATLQSVRLCEPWQCVSPGNVSPGNVLPHREVSPQRLHWYVLDCYGLCAVQHHSGHPWQQSGRIVDLACSTDPAQISSDQKHT